MKLNQDVSLRPNKDGCDITAKQNKFYDKLVNEIKALQTQLIDLQNKVDARDEVIDTLDLNTRTLSVGESTTTKNLYVNGETSLQGNTEVNDLTVNGKLNVLLDMSVELLRVTELFADNAHLDEAEIRSSILDVARIKQALLRFDTNQDVISFPSENITQLGDIANSILLAGLERPTWNGSPLALASDLSGGLTPNYKGMLETETELPESAKVGDFYLIKNVTRKTESGLGSAIYGVSKKWEIKLYYELLNYFNKEEINQLFDDELQDDINRETDIIKGNTPVQVVANGCVNKAGELLATTDDAFMLSGPEGMDNIARNSSLDDLVICGQYSADDDLAMTITEKPNGENGAFDIAVGLFSGSKQDIYQLYTGKASQKIYFRIGLNKEFNGWYELAYTNGETPTEIAKRLFTHGNITSFDLPNNFGNKVVTYNGSATNAPSPTSNGEAMTFSKGGSEQAVIAFDNNKNDMYFKTQFGDWKGWKKTASLDKDGYVEKAQLAKNLEENAKIGNLKVESFSTFEPKYPTAGWNRLITMGLYLQDVAHLDITTKYGTLRGSALSFIIALATDNDNIIQLACSRFNNLFTKIRIGVNTSKKEKYIDIFQDGTPNFTNVKMKTVENNIKISNLIPVEETEQGTVFTEYPININEMLINGVPVATTDSFVKGLLIENLENPDWNTIKTTGYYKVRVSVEGNNAPRRGTFLLSVISNKSQITQNAIELNGNATITRTIASASETWKEWKEIATVNKVKTLTLDNEIAANTDYDTIVNIGNYCSGPRANIQTCTHVPFTEDPFDMTVEEIYPGYLVQTAIAIKPSFVMKKMRAKLRTNQWAAWQTVQINSPTQLQAYNQGIIKEVTE